MKIPRLTPSRRFTFANLSIALRLQLGFLIVLLLLAALGVMNWLQTGMLSDSTRRLVEEDGRRGWVANDMQIAVQDMALALGTLCQTEDGDEARRVQDDYKAALARYDVSKKTLRELPARVDAAAWKQALTEMEVTENNARSLFDQLAGMAGQADVHTLQDFYATQVSTPQMVWMDSLGNLRKAIANSMDDAARAAAQTAHHAQLATAALSTAAVLIGLLWATLISRSITRPLSRAIQMAETVATGDLTAELIDSRRDEIGKLLHSLRSMQQSLRTLVGDIQMSADNLGRFSTEVASANGDLSQRTEMASASLEQTSSSLQQLTSAVRRNADSAAQATKVATGTAETAHLGGQVVEKVVGSMQGIANDSRAIATIIAVIDDIAFRTNLLALNAAVEAAQAGPQGRGFAVVAEEVRALAQNTAQSARDIKALVDGSASRVNEGTRLAQDAGRSMAGIVSAVLQVTAMMESISKCTAEERSGLEQLNVAVEQLHLMTQQNAALVEQNNAATEALRDQAGHLSALVSTFRLPVPPIIAAAV